MPNLNELREVVEDVNKNGIKGAKVGSLLDCVALATEVIEAKMPEEIDKENITINPNYRDGYNQALHDFRLYQTKKRAGLEEVLPDMLAKAQIKVDDTHYDVDIKILAQAIREEMR